MNDGERVRQPRVWVGHDVDAIRKVSTYIVDAARISRIPDWFRKAMKPILDEMYNRSRR